MQVRRGDVTTARTDALVTSTDRDLSVSGGVNAAVHAAAGPTLRAACAAAGGCGIGEAFSTDSGELGVRRVIHTVVPTWTDGQSGERLLLEGCYRAVLEAARADECRSIALPSLGTGARGVPPGVAAEIAVTTFAARLDAALGYRGLVEFWLDDDALAQIYGEAILQFGGSHRRARRSDFWFEDLEADPLSLTRPLAWTRLLDETEAVFVRAGLISRDMDEKWFVYEEAGMVHCHRSWTGYEVFSFRIRDRPDGRPGALLDQVSVCDDPTRYTASEDEAIKQLETLVGWLATRSLA